MKGCYLDSNFLVYSRNETAAQFHEVLAKLEDLTKNKTRLYVSPLVLDEFIHTFRFLISRKRSKSVFGVLKKVVNEILEIPRLEIVGIPLDVDSQLEVINLMETYSLSPRDAYHILTILANDIDGFATFDKDFRKVFRAKLLKKA